jgi:di/tricarboxylate transporter
MNVKYIYENFLPFWRTFVLVLTPLVFLPVLLSGTPDQNNDTDNNRDLFNGSLPSPVAIGSSLDPSSHAKEERPSDYEPMVCAYVLLIMSVYWMTETLPLPITSLIPVVAFPLAGVMSTVRTIFFCAIFLNAKILAI